MPQETKNNSKINKDAIVNNYLQTLIPSDAGINSFNPVQNALAQPATQRSINLAGSFAGDVDPFFKFKSTDVFSRLDEIEPYLSQLLKNEGFWGQQKEYAKGIIRTDPNWAQKLNIKDPYLIAHGNKYAELNTAGSEILNKKYSPINWNIYNPPDFVKNIKNDIMGKILPFIKPE